MSRFFSRIFALLISFSIALNASAEIDKTNPYKMIEQVAEQTFKRVANQQEQIKQDPNLLKVVVREELLPYINYRYAAARVLGQQFKKTTKAERDQFYIAFRDYLVTSYAQVFTLYNNQKVEFEREKAFADKKIVAINTRVLEPGREPINLAFKVRKNKKTKQWQAYDMVAEGVSLLDSKKAEFASVIRQKGIAHVTETLIEKSRSNISFKDSKAN